MPKRDQTLLNRRNEAIRQRYRATRQKNPKWQIDYVIEAVANEFYLSPVTVSKVLFNDGAPAASTIYRRVKAVA